MPRSHIVYQSSLCVSMSSNPEKQKPAFLPASLTLLEGLLNEAWGDFTAHCQTARNAAMEVVYEIELQCVLFARRFIRAGK
ncbi:MAG TPA: hypothetical protein V6C52_13115 [Coleofasciculaceae cyanobacterium]